MCPGVLASLEWHHNVTGSVKDWFLPSLTRQGQQVCARGSCLVPALQVSLGLIPGREWIQGAEM